MKTSAHALVLIVLVGFAGYFGDRREAGGIVTLVAREGKVVDVHASGFQDVESKTPMNRTGCTAGAGSTARSSGSTPKSGSSRS